MMMSLSCPASVNMAACRCRLLLSLLVLILLCLILRLPCQSLARARDIKGAAGLHQPSIAASIRQHSPSASIYAWQWSYLDPVPDSSLAAAYAHPPSPIGVADVDVRDQHGERGVPAIRYGHAAVAGDNYMYITHGYHYDMSPSHGGAIWLSDTWSFSLYDSDDGELAHSWRRLHDHITHPDEGPVARYGAVATLVAGDLYLHGGDDGGHAQRLPSYQHSVYGDIWRFILRPSSKHNHALHTWVRIHSAVSTFMFDLAAPIPPLPNPTSAEQRSREQRPSSSMNPIDPRLARDGLYRCQHATTLVLIAPDHALHRSDSHHIHSSPSHRDVVEDASEELSQPAPYWFASHGLYTLPKSIRKDGTLDLDRRNNKRRKKKQQRRKSKNRNRRDRDDGDDDEDEEDEDDDDDVVESTAVMSPDDLWVFSFRTRRWQQILTTNNPPPRFGHSLAFMPDFGAATHQNNAGAEAVSWSDDSVVATGVTDMKIRGSLFLYGGFSRRAPNLGDLWRLDLYPTSDTNGVKNIGRWILIHDSDSPGLGQSPGRRGYANMHPLPLPIGARSLHLFAGARCEPGCVCSDEYWMYDIDTKRESDGSLKSSDGSHRDSHSLSSSPSPTHGWTLLAHSPHSPSSHSYPSRKASGHPHFDLYTKADESVEKGWPVHRYKQTFVRPMFRVENALNISERAAMSSASVHSIAWSFFLFGGESYGPSAYYHDVWRFDLTHSMQPPAASLPSSSSSAHSALFLHSLRRLESFDRLLHLTSRFDMEVELPMSERVAQRSFDRLEPPGGWGRFIPRNTQRQPRTSLSSPPHRSTRNTPQQRATGASTSSDPSHRSSSNFFTQFLSMSSSDRRSRSMAFWLTIVGSMSLVLLIGFIVIYFLLIRSNARNDERKTD